MQNGRISISTFSVKPGKYDIEIDSVISVLILAKALNGRLSYRPSAYSATQPMCVKAIAN